MPASAGPAPRFCKGFGGDERGHVPWSGGCLIPLVPFASLLPVYERTVCHDDDHDAMPAFSPRTAWRSVIRRLSDSLPFDDLSALQARSALHVTCVTFDRFHSRQSPILLGRPSAPVLSTSYLSASPCFAYRLCRSILTSSSRRKNMQAARRFVRPLRGCLQPAPAQQRRRQGVDRWRRLGKKKGGAG